MTKVKLGEVTVNLDNRRKPLNNVQRQEKSVVKKYAYCGANNIVDYIDDYIFDETDEILCIAEDGGSWGKEEKCTYIMREKCWVNNHAHVIKMNEGVDINYISLFLNYTDLTPYITGSTRGKLTKSSLENIELDLPDYEAQVGISKKILSIQDLMEKKKKQLAKLSELVKSRFIEFFGHPETNEKGWKINTFADICTVRQGLQIPISKRLTEYEENCYEYITVQYLHGGKEQEYIKCPKSTVICNKEDILMTRTGNTGMVVTGVDGVFHNNFFLIDFDRNRYDKNFLVQYLNLDIIQTDIRRRAGTSTIPDLNHSEFYKIPVFEPPIELQIQFNNFIKQVDKSQLAGQMVLKLWRKLLKFSIIKLSFYEK